MHAQITDVVAEREFQLVNTEGTTKTVRVLFGRPEPDAAHRTSLCPYQVLGLGKEKLRKIGGADSVQALLLAIEAAAHEIKALVGENTLRWMDISFYPYGLLEGRPHPEERRGG